jgi:flagellar basal-body rod protein FlgG
MVKGIYHSTSGMQPAMLKIEIISNNLANIDTTGYKRDSVFIQVLNKASNFENKGQSATQSLDVKRHTDFSSGSYLSTSNPFDVAIEGRGFFAVQTSEGTRYTRNGNFVCRSDGALITPQGHQVLGRSGPIIIPNMKDMIPTDVTISQMGEISVNKTIIDSIRVVDFDTLSSLKKQGDSLFTSSIKENPAAVDGKSVIVRQGVIESSNVDSISEMIEMIEMSKMFESDQKAVQKQEDTLTNLMSVGRL